MEEKIGYVLTEILLWILVLIPFLYVAKYTWGYFHRKVKKWYSTCRKDTCYEIRTNQWRTNIFWDI